MDQLALEAAFDYLEKHEVEPAKRIFEEALNESFMEDVACFGKGCCYSLSNRPAEAIECFKKSEELPMPVHDNIRGEDYYK